MSTAESEEKQTRHNRCRVHLSESEEVSDSISRKRPVGRRDVQSASTKEAQGIPALTVPLCLLQSSQNFKSNRVIPCATAVSSPCTPAPHVPVGVLSKNRSKLLSYLGVHATYKVSKENL